LILLCIVAFGALYTIGLALLPDGIQHTETAAPESIFDVHKFAEIFARNIHVLGDPIDNPKPNRFRR